MTPHVDLNHVEFARMCSLGIVQTPGIQQTSPSSRANHCDRCDPILGMCKNSDLATLFEPARQDQAGGWLALRGSLLPTATDADNDDGLSLHELLQSFARIQLAEAAPIVAVGLRLEPEP